MEHVIQYFNGIHKLPVRCNSRLRKILKRKVLKKKEILLRAGEICDYVYFVDTGLLRGYEIDSSEQEITTSFMKEGDIVAGILTMLEQRVSTQYIQALEDTVLYYITFEEQQELFSSFLAFNVVGRILLARYCYLLEMRLHAFLTMDGASRYRWFRETFPDFLLRVPLKYQASYLGIEVTSLSRIRGRR